MTQSEAQKRAKAKYYAKLRESEEYRARMAQRSREYYEKTENKEKHNETVKKYVEANKEKIYKQVKEKRKEKKVQSVVSKLESIDVQTLAKILIEARKTKLLDFED